MAHQRRVILGIIMKIKGLREGLRRETVVLFCAQDMLEGTVFLFGEIPFLRKIDEVRGNT